MHQINDSASSMSASPRQGFVLGHRHFGTVFPVVAAVWCNLYQSSFGGIKARPRKLHFGGVVPGLKICQTHVLGTHIGMVWHLEGVEPSKPDLNRSSGHSRHSWKWQLSTSWNTRDPECPHKPRIHIQDANSQNPSQRPHENFKLRSSVTPHCGTLQHTYIQK